MSFPYEHVVDPASANMDAKKLAKVVEKFKLQQSVGAFPGGQLVVKRNRKLVVNEAIGVARRCNKDEVATVVQVEPKTPFPVYSCGKPLASIVVAMLEDRGKLDVNAPIAEYFPEFAKNNKDNITTLDVLTHRSGILMSHLAYKMELWGNREVMLKELIEIKPSYPRGTLAYGPGEFGWILSEVVRHIDGRGLTEYFKEEIATPLGLSELRFGLSGRDLKSLSHSYWLGKDKVMVAGFNAAYKFEELNNSKLYFDSLNPAFTLITDAASLAAFYDFLLSGGKTVSGDQLISEKVLRQYTSRHVFALDKSIKAYLAVGRGFLLGTLTPSFYGWWNTKQCFGHAGMFSCVAFGDYQKNLSIAIFTNGNRGIGDFMKRFMSLNHGFRKACL